MECIKTLPEGIVDHPHLRDATELDLRSSRLLRLPERFGELTNLKTLDLLHCKALVALPERFGELRNLQTLDLSGTALVTLPKRFGELKNLTMLSLILTPAGRSVPATLKVQLEAQGYNVNTGV